MATSSPSLRLGYLGAVLAVLVASFATHIILPWIQPSVSLLFFPACVVPALYWGYGPALLASMLSAVSLAYLFIPPRYSFNIGTDDMIRLGAFNAVALVMAYVSAARKRAEDAASASLAALEAANDVLNKVSGWPVLIDSDGAAGVRKMLEHAAEIVGATEVRAAWEAEQEPLAYFAAPSRIDVITKCRPDEVASLLSTALAGTPHETGMAPSDRQGANPALGMEFPLKGVLSVAFATEYLNGSVYFAGMGHTATIPPAIQLVAREVRSTLDHLYLAEQMRSMAAHEERIRMARDLHDGVLQSLTGIRLQLRAMTEQDDEQATRTDRLLAIERAIAIEQRELRLFIDDVHPRRRTTTDSGELAQGFEDMRQRLEVEWKTPITIRITPADTSLPQPIYRALRLMIHEALINALKHAHPSRVSVDVQADDLSQLHILVVNDGHGFPFTGRLEHDALLCSDAGPLSLRDRVVALGGKIAVESNPNGARVEILLSVEA